MLNYHDLYSVLFVYLSRIECDQVGQKELAATPSLICLSWSEVTWYKSTESTVLVFSCLNIANRKDRSKTLV